MTWANLKATGSGRVKGFALVIEGWPHIFTSNRAITVSADLDGRTVIPGLLNEGIRFRERAIPREGRYEVDAITFKFRPHEGTRSSSGTTDPITQSFARVGVPVAALASTILTSEDEIPLEGSSTLENDTYYHIGTETILTDTFPDILRARWGTTAQIHFTSYGQGIQDVQVYDFPTTMDGRRCWLYIYCDGDDLTELSIDNIVWRGVVTRPPSRQQDGVTWAVQANHISHVLRQSLVGHEAEIKIVGIYHHRLAPVQIQLQFNGSTSTAFWLAGFYLTPEALCDDINTQIAAAMTDVGITTTEVISLSISYNSFRSQYMLNMRTGVTAPDDLVPWIVSPLIGSADGFYWTSETGFPARINELDDLTNYSWPLTLPLPAVRRGKDQVFLPGLEFATFPATALGGPKVLAGAPDAALPADDDPIHDYPEWRIYVDQDFETYSLDALYIHIAEDDVQYPDATGVRASRPGGTFEVTTIDEDGDGNKYIEVYPRDLRGGTGPTIGLFAGFLTGETILHPMVDYSSTSASKYGVVDLIAKLIELAPASNNGIVPMVTDDDFDTVGSIIALPTLPDAVRSRTYEFIRPEKIEDVLSQELLLSGSMLYTTATNRLAIRPLPLFTDTHVTTKTIAGDKIITPAHGYGAWPGYELHPQGIVTTVRIQQGYDPIEGEYTGRMYEARDKGLIARHKKGGVSEVDIEPRSNAAGGAELELADAQIIAGQLFALAGREYVAVKVRVKFTAYDYLLGDIVTLTSKHVPNSSDGTTGLTGKRACVMGREWNLDAAQQDWGELELWILLDAVAGYAPSAVITAQSDQGSNLWNLTCSVANALNVLLSTEGDGQLMAHFAAGDYVRAVQVNHISNQQTGRIVGTPSAAAGTCVVQFDGVVALGSNTWVLEFQHDTGSTAQSGQRAYTYVADDSKQLATDTYARRYA